MKSKISSMVLGSLLLFGLSTTSLMAADSKCGAGKCGDDKKEMTSSKCGDDKKTPNTKCGDDKKTPNTKCGDDKKEAPAINAKCGAGKCGANK